MGSITAVTSGGAGFTPEQMARLAKAREAAQKFEAAFIYQFLELSSPAPDKNNPMNGGVGEEMFRHNLNEQAAAAVTQRGGFGLANQILGQLAQRGDIPALPAGHAANAYQMTSGKVTP